MKLPILCVIQRASEECVEPALGRPVAIFGTTAATYLSALAFKKEHSTSGVNMQCEYAMLRGRTISNIH